MRISLLVSVGVAAVVLSVGAQEIPPNATPSTTAKSGGAVGKLDSEQKTEGTKQASPATPPIPTCTQAFPCFVVEEPQAKSKEEQAKNDSLDALYRSYLWATIIGVIGALIGVVVLICQTILVRISADAARMNAQAVINSERAWIDVTGMANPTPGWTKKLPLHFFRVHNSGRTPAQLISGTIDHAFVDTPNDLPVSPKYKTYFNSPNKTFITSSTYFDTSPLFNPRAIIENRSLAEKNVSSYQILIFYGRIIYEDVLGKRAHETRWCYAWFDDERGFVRTGPDGERYKAYNDYT